MGMQAVHLRRHDVSIREDGAGGTVSLVSKHATPIERLTLTRLQSQQANVPFHFANDPNSDSRTLTILEHVDCETDDSQLNFQKLQASEWSGLAHIHAANRGKRDELPGLPDADLPHIQAMMNQRWRPS